MDIAFYVTFFVVLIVLMAISGPVARWTRLPVPAIQILIGCGVVYTVTLGFGIDTGLRAANFHDLVFYVFLPVIVFEAAVSLALRSVWKDLLPVLLLAIVGLLATTLLSAVLIFFGIGHPTGFPWVAALLTGALLSATDPSAVISELRRIGVTDRLVGMLEGESLFNDALAIVLFSFFLGMALMEEGAMSAGEALGQFVLAFCGGILVGVAGGWLARVLMRLNPSTVADTAITLASAYGVYLVAELAFDVSGAMAALGAGLVIGRSADTREDDLTDRFWDVLVYLSNGSLFLLMGATITMAMFRERWLAMLIAVGAALMARAVLVGGVFNGLRPFSRDPVSYSQQGVLIWGGVRGAVTLALALSLPVELDYWWTIQSMAFGVVLFTLLVQAPTLPLVVRNRKTDPAPAETSGS